MRNNIPDSHIKILDAITHLNSALCCLISKKHILRRFAICMHMKKAKWQGKKTF